MRAMLRPMSCWHFGSRALVVTQLLGEIDQVDELLLGEVDLLEEAPSMQVYGHVLSLPFGL